MIGKFADKVRVDSPVDFRDIRENIRVNHQRGIPDLTALKPIVVPERRRPCAIVGAGPSLEGAINDITDDMIVISCGRSYPVLLEHGIVPDYVVTTDRTEKPAEFLKPESDTVFLVDSACDTKVFDTVSGRKVYMFNSIFKEFDYKKHLRSVSDNSRLTTINVGLCVVHACMTIAFLFGHRDAHVFGFDSMKGYAKGVPGDTEKDWVIVEVGDYHVYTAPEFFIYAVHMIPLKNLLGKYGFKTTFHGNTLTEIIENEVLAGRYTLPEVV